MTIDILLALEISCTPQKDRHQVSGPLSVRTFLQTASLPQSLICCAVSCNPWGSSVQKYRFCRVIIVSQHSTHLMPYVFTVILAERGWKRVTKETSDWESAGWNQFERIEKRSRKWEKGTSNWMRCTENSIFLCKMCSVTYIRLLGNKYILHVNSVC